MIMNGLLIFDFRFCGLCFGFGKKNFNCEFIKYFN